jgi:sec-independent protein translocase protein TatC
MGTEPTDYDPLPEFDEEGGPVKSFLEHLEDLRWTLIKSLAAVIVAMLVCMIGGRYIVDFLLRPLNQTWFSRAAVERTVPVHMGTNFIGRIPAAALGFADPGTGATNAAPTNVLRSVSIQPMLIGTNYVLALQPDTVDYIAPDTLPPVIKNYGPLSSVMVAMKLALWGGLILGAPFIFYFVGQFVLPALRVHEKKILYQAVGIGTFLFFLGVAFCYFIVTSVALKASVQFSSWLGFGADEWRAEDYISFVTKFMLGMGLSFELPVVILVLVKIGLLDHERLSGFRSYMVVINLVAAAFITPSGDPFTMLLFAVPLQLLYEISVLVAWWWERAERKAALKQAS